MSGSPTVKSSSPSPFYSGLLGEILLYIILIHSNSVFFYEMSPKSLGYLNTWFQLVAVSGRIRMCDYAGGSISLE